MMVQILAKMSVSGTLCLIAVILLRQFMRKTRHRDFMVLWTAVMMAYCIPFSVSVKSDHPVTQAVQRAEQEIGSTVYAAVTESTVMSANDLLLILKYIYILTFLLLLALYIYRYHRFSELLAESVPDKRSGIYYSDMIPGPCCSGIFSSRCYLPYGMSESEIRYILMHEKIHAAYHDPLLLLIGRLVCILHWYNPFVYLAYHLMETDMEMRCDEIASVQLDVTEQKEYAKALAVYALKHSVLPVSSFFSESGLTVRRVKNLLKLSEKKDRRIICILCTVLLCAFSAVRVECANRFLIYPLRPGMYLPSPADTGKLQSSVVINETFELSLSSELPENLRVIQGETDGVSGYFGLILEDPLYKDENHNYLPYITLRMYRWSFESPDIHIDKGVKGLNGETIYIWQDDSLLKEGLPLKHYPEWYLSETVRGGRSISEYLDNVFSF